VSAIRTTASAATAGARSTAAAPTQVASVSVNQTFRSSDEKKLAMAPPSLSERRRGKKAGGSGAAPRRQHDPYSGTFGPGVRFIHYLTKQAAKTSEIFKKAAFKPQVEHLDKLIASGMMQTHAINFDDYNIHVIGRCLRNFLQKAPALIPSNCAATALQTYAAQGNQFCPSIKPLIHALPFENRYVLGELSVLFWTLWSNTASTKMDNNSLSYAFAPLVLRSSVQSRDPAKVAQQMKSANAAFACMIANMNSLFPRISLIMQAAAVSSTTAAAPPSRPQQQQQQKVSSTQSALASKAANLMSMYSDY
jgi:hypothetical protein